MIRYFSFLIILSLNLGYSQNANGFDYIQVPDSIVNIIQFDKPKIQLVEALKYLPKNHSKSGDVDYTVELQRAIDENSSVILPNFQILINDKGLHLRSNSSIFFQEKSKLLLSASSKTNYGILNAVNISNAFIYNPHLYGDRDIHIGYKGEWGMGINILGSSKINIYNPYIEKCWGDGIYIGGTDNVSSSEIEIKGGVIDNNRRNGISIVSGYDILLEHIVLSNTNGTLPMAGIDLEPNGNTDSLNNIKLNNITSFNNAMEGFLVYLGGFLGGISKEVNISLNKCRDIKSKNSISIPGLRNDYVDKEKLRGKIKINNFKSYDSMNIFAKSSGNYMYTPYIEINNLQEFKKNNRSIESIRNLNDWFVKRSYRNSLK